MLQDLVTPLKGEFRDYTELRAQVNTRQAVYISKGNLLANTKEIRGGVNARVYRNGVFGVASAPEYDTDSLRAVVAAASRNARFLDQKEKPGKGPLLSVPTGSMIYGEDREVSQKLLPEVSRELDAYVTEKYPGLVSRFVSARHMGIEKLSAVSDSYDIHSYLPKANLYVGLTVEDKDGKPCDLTCMYGRKGFFDEIFADLSFFKEEIEKVYEKLMHKREAVYAEAGVKECILAPMLTGMLSHEAVGHTVEADLVMGGSVAGHMLGREVASEKVTMVDFAHHYAGEELSIPVYVDDEGTLAQDAVLIENGILKGYMHDKASAMHYGVVPTGNARAFGFADEPLIRMRNTAVLPGTDKLEDMIASIDDGYYLLDTNNGQADTTGEFMFGVTSGYEIKNGKLGRAIKETTISGVAFDMLKTVSMVGDDLEWDYNGMCGKKQSIAVGMGGPSIKCRVTIGGR